MRLIVPFILLILVSSCTETPTIPSETSKLKFDSFILSIKGIQVEVAYSESSYTPMGGNQSRNWYEQIYMNSSQSFKPDTTSYVSDSLLLINYSKYGTGYSIYDKYKCRIRFSENEGMIDSIVYITENTDQMTPDHASSGNGSGGSFEMVVINAPYRIENDTLLAIELKGSDIASRLISLKSSSSSHSYDRSRQSSSNSHRNIYKILSIPDTSSIKIIIH